MTSKPAPPMLNYSEELLRETPSTARPLPQDRAQLVAAIEDGDLLQFAENITDGTARFYTQAFLDAVHTLHYFDEGLPVDTAPEPGVPACNLVPPDYAEALAAAAAQAGLTDALLSHADWSQHLSNTRRRKSTV